MGQGLGGGFGYHLNILGKAGADVTGVNLLVLIELAAEKTAEHAQADGVGLAYACLGGEQEIYLA